MMGKQRGNKKCLEALKVTGVVAASTGTRTHNTRTHTHTHGRSWPALGKQKPTGFSRESWRPETWQLQKPLERDTQHPRGLGSVHEIRPGFPSLVAHTVKNLPALCLQETLAWSLGCEDPMAKGIATHSSIFAWRIPWTEEPGRLQFMGSQSQTWLRD